MVRDTPVQVVLVGQTPPPFGGQAVMIHRLVGGTYERIALHHVRLAFSHDMDEVGKVTLRKIGHLVAVVIRIMRARVRFHAEVLYYPPAGPSLVPVYRDIVILLLTRWLFRRVVFHFHAGGLSELHPRLRGPLRHLYRRAYYGADLAIRLSPSSPEDGRLLQARAERIIPYGIEDRGGRLLVESEGRRVATRILYVGVLKETKGILVLVGALDLLHRAGVDCELVAVGRFESPAFQKRVFSRVRAEQLEARVQFPGVLVGDRKDDAFLTAGVFCFPTFFEAESSSVAVLEAMQFGLPIVATRWRGAPSLVQDGVTGVLVPPRDPAALAEGLRRLLADPGRGREMGQRGRERFLSHHTLARYRQAVEEAICSAAADDGN